MRLEVERVGEIQSYISQTAPEVVRRWSSFHRCRADGELGWTILHQIWWSDGSQTTTPIVVVTDDWREALYPPDYQIVWVEMGKLPVGDPRMEYILKKMYQREFKER